MIQRYREMVDDPLRLAAFRRAIEAAVGEGTSVIDVGCGLGTYAIFAARAGATRVVAIDEGPVAEVAREVVRANGCEDRVRVVRGRSTEVEPQGRVDLAIFEDYVSGLLTPQIVHVLRDLRARWLKPGGRLLPARARVFAALVAARDMHHALDRFHATQERVAGVDFGAARRRAIASTHAASLGAAALLAEPLLVDELDLVTLDVARINGKGRVVVTRDAVAHGVLVWFALELGPTWLGTGPLDPTSAWRQLFLPFAEPLRVDAGASVDLELEAAPLGDALLWRWSATTPTTRAAAHSLDGLVLGADALKGGRPDLVHARGEELEIDAEILASVDGARDQGAIGALLQARFPSRFATKADAEQRVARVLGRYRKPTPT